MSELSVENLKAKPDDELIDLINHGTTHGDKINAILTGRMLEKLVNSLNTKKNALLLSHKWPRVSDLR